MNREIHVRICGGLEVKFLRSTRLKDGENPNFIGILLIYLDPPLFSFAPKHRLFYGLYF